MNTCNEPVKFKLYIIQIMQVVRDDSFVNVLQSRPYGNNLNLVGVFVMDLVPSPGSLNLGPISGNHYTIFLDVFNRDSH